MNSAFDEILEKSKKFDREIGELLQGAIPPSTRRGMITAVREHFGRAI